MAELLWAKYVKVMESCYPRNQFLKTWATDAVIYLDIDPQKALQTTYSPSIIIICGDTEISCRKHWVIQVFIRYVKKDTVFGLTAKHVNLKSRKSP